MRIARIARVVMQELCETCAKQQQKSCAFCRAPKWKWTSPDSESTVPETGCFMQCLLTFLMLLGLEGVVRPFLKRSS